VGSYFKLIDFVYHSTLGLRVIEKRREECLKLDPYRLKQALDSWLSIALDNPRIIALYE